MRKYIYVFCQLFICCLVFTGCDRYLDINPKGTKLLTTVDDYDQWLNDETLALGISAPYGTINFLGDNADVVSITNPPMSAAELVYTWASQFQRILTFRRFFGENITLRSTSLIRYCSESIRLAEERPLKLEA